MSGCHLAEYYHDLWPDTPSWSIWLFLNLVQKKRLPKLATNTYQNLRKTLILKLQVDSKQQHSFLPLSLCQHKSGSGCLQLSTQGLPLWGSDHSPWFSKTPFCSTGDSGSYEHTSALHCEESARGRQEVMEERGREEIGERGRCYYISLPSLSSRVHSCLIWCRQKDLQRLHPYKIQSSKKVVLWFTFLKS